MKKNMEEDFESYDEDGLEIAITEFAAGVATFIQRMKKDAELVIESVVDDVRLQTLSFLEDEDEDLEDDYDVEEDYNESTHYDSVILESNKWMYGESSSLNEARTKKKVPYVHKGNSSFTIKKIEDTYGTDKLLAQAEFKVYASLFESSKDHEGSKTSNLSTTLMDKKAFKSDLKDGKFITLKGDPADDGYKRKVLDKDFSKVLADVKELRSDYLKGK